MQIEYPKSIDDISPERQEELERDIRHFLRFSPCQRLRYVEKEWLSLQRYIRAFGITWKRSSRQKRFRSLSGEAREILASDMSNRPIWGYNGIRGHRFRRMVSMGRIEDGD